MARVRKSKLGPRRLQQENKKKYKKIKLLRLSLVCLLIYSFLFSVVYGITMEKQYYLEKEKKTMYIKDLRKS